MQNRKPDSLEKSLSVKIQDRNEKIASVLVDVIIEDSHAQLNYIDEQGQSFLHLALKFGLKNLAEKILAIHLKDAKKVNGVDCFLLTDEQKQTCLFLAAKQRYADIVYQLLQYSQSIQAADKLGYQLWLKEDSNGDTPLHAIASNQVSDNCENERVLIAEMLLEKYSQEIDAKLCITRVNKQGDTPLHLACSRKDMVCDVRIIALLIKYGASLTLENEKKQTPLQTILCLDLAEKVKLLEILKTYDEAGKNKTCLQKDMLALFQEHADREIMHTDTKEKAMQIKEDFVTLACFCSLKEGVQARIAFENDIFKFDNPRPENPVIDDLMSLLKKDRDKLNDLSDTIDNFLNFLNTQPEIAVTKKQKRIGATAATLSISFLVYVSLETWLAIKNEQALEMNPSKHSDYFFGALFFGVFGAILASVVGFLSWDLSTYSDTYTEIAQDQWKEIENILEEIIMSIHLLENTAAVKLSDEYSQRKIALEADLVGLKQPTKMILDLKNDLGVLKTDVDEMKSIVRVSNTPFSIFQQPRNHDNPAIVVNLSDSDESGLSTEISDEENHIFLKRA